MASNKITKKDLNEMAVRSMAEQCCFSFERMQAVGFCYGMTKCFRKIHGDNNEEMAAAMANNLDFINTEPHMAAILQGLIVSMEEAGQNREMIHSLKTGLFGPLAGLGDAIWWYTAMPIIASICCSLATQNNVLGPIFYILFWALTAIFSRIWFVRLGYNAGVSSIKFIGDNAAYISKAAGILGVMVVGGLIPSYVSFAGLCVPALLAVQEEERQHHEADPAGHCFVGCTVLPGHHVSFTAAARAGSAFPREPPFSRTILS